MTDRCVADTVKTHWLAVKTQPNIAHELRNLMARKDASRSKM